MAGKTENNCKVNPEKVHLETDQGIVESEERKWGMPLKDVYKHGLSFYKDKEGKALHLSYEDRLKLIAYTQQTSHGPLDINSAPPLGVLDVIGRDRRAAWQALGKMSQIQAMVAFVHNLDRLCPLFKPYLEAIQKDLEDKKQQQYKKEEEERANIELQNRIALEKQKQQSTKLTEEQQVQRIKDALNAQTYDQFLQYAQQQYPGNFDQQAVLIRQLQDRHYQQYIQQLAVDERLANSNIKDDTEDKETENNKVSEHVTTTPDSDYNLNEPEVNIMDTKALQISAKSESGEYTEEPRDEENSDDDVGDSGYEYYEHCSWVAHEFFKSLLWGLFVCGGLVAIASVALLQIREWLLLILDGFPAVEEARMWTRVDVSQFKDLARAGGGCLTVGHGETVTVRVPTHPKARCLCWEFATDNYDIGFGLYFEWTKSPTTEVTIHVSESDDEDELNDPDAPDYSDDGDTVHEYTIHGTRTDLELGGERSALAPKPEPPRTLISLVVPIYRRDCHTEVYAGAHTYPGEGVYLLKFDNTYSLWRSKTLYYKIYYTQ